MVQHADIDHSGVTGVTGNVATDAIWDAAGDLAQGTGANTAAKLSSGATGKVLQAAGATTAVAWKYPPGYEFDYVEKTSNTSVTATTEAGADTIVTGASIAYDGSTIVEIEWYAAAQNNPAGVVMRVVLFDGSSCIGELCENFAAASIYVPSSGKRRLTPSNASHQYSVRAWVDASGTGNIIANTGGTSIKPFPCFMRITKVSGGA